MKVELKTKSKQKFCSLSKPTPQLQSSISAKAAKMPLGIFQLLGIIHLSVRMGFFWLAK